MGLKGGMGMNVKMNLSSGWESKLAHIPAWLLVVVGPILGLIYITLVPIVTIVTFVLTGGFSIIHRLEFKHPVQVKSVLPPQ
jgi:hypothetical protein